MTRFACTLYSLVLILISQQACRFDSAVLPCNGSQILVYEGEESNLPEAAFAMIRSQDDQLILAGSWQANALLMKVNTCGDTLWQKHFILGDSSSVLFDLVQLENGQIVALGNCTRCTAGSDYIQSVLIRTDRHGQLLQTQTLQSPDQKNLRYQSLTLQDGQFLLAGLEGEGATANMAWSLVDEGFKPIGETIRRLSIQNFDRIRSVVAMPSGGFAFCGSAGRIDSSWVVVGKLDASADLLMYQNYYPGINECIWFSCSPSEARQILYTNDDRLYIAGTARANSNNGLDGFVAELNPSTLEMNRQHLYGLPNTYESVESMAIGQDLELLLGLSIRDTALGQSYTQVLELDPLLEVEQSYRFFESGLSASAPYALVPLWGDASAFAMAGNKWFFDAQDIIFATQLFEDP